MKTLLIRFFSTGNKSPHRSSSALATISLAITVLAILSVTLIGSSFSSFFRFFADNNSNNNRNDIIGLNEYLSSSRTSGVLVDAQRSTPAPLPTFPTRPTRPKPATPKPRTRTQTPQLPPPEPTRHRIHFLPAIYGDITVYAAGIAAMLAGLVGPYPLLPMQTARLLLLFEMVDCGASLLDIPGLPFPVTVFPGTHFSFKSKPERNDFLRGTIIANLCFGVALTAISIFFGLFLNLYDPSLASDEEGGIGWKAVTAAMFPSTMIIVQSLFYLGTIYCVCALLIVSDEYPYDIPIAVLTIFLVAVVLIFTARSIWNSIYIERAVKGFAAAPEVLGPAAESCLGQVARSSIALTLFYGKNVWHGPVVRWSPNTLRSVEEAKLAPAPRRMALLFRNFAPPVNAMAGRSTPSTPMRNANNTPNRNGGAGSSRLPRNGSSGSFSNPVSMALLSSTSSSSANLIHSNNINSTSSSVTIINPPTTAAPSSPGGAVTTFITESITPLLVTHYFFLEAFFTFAFAVVQSVFHSSCESSIWGLFAMAVIPFAFSVYLRPNIVPLAQVLTDIVLFVTAVGYLFIALNHTSIKLSKGTLRDISDTCGLVGVGVVLFAMIISVFSSFAFWKSGCRLLPEVPNISTHASNLPSGAQLSYYANSNTAAVTPLRRALPVHNRTNSNNSVLGIGRGRGGAGGGIFRGGGGGGITNNNTNNRTHTYFQPHAAGAQHQQIPQNNNNRYPTNNNNHNQNRAPPSSIGLTGRLSSNDDGDFNSSTNSKFINNNNNNNTGRSYYVPPAARFEDEDALLGVADNSRNVFSPANSHSHNNNNHNHNKPNRNKDFNTRDLLSENPGLALSVEPGKKLTAEKRGNYDSDGSLGTDDEENDVEVEEEEEQLDLNLDVDEDTNTNNIKKHDDDSNNHGDEHDREITNHFRENNNSNKSKNKSQSVSTSASTTSSTNVSTKVKRGDENYYNDEEGNKNNTTINPFNSNNSNNSEKYPSSSRTTTKSNCSVKSTSSGPNSARSNTTTSASNTSNNNNKPGSTFATPRIMLANNNNTSNTSFDLTRNSQNKDDNNVLQITVDKIQQEQNNIRNSNKVVAASATGVVGRPRSGTQRLTELERRNLGTKIQEKMEQDEEEATLQQERKNTDMIARDEKVKSSKTVTSASPSHPLPGSGNERNVFGLSCNNNNNNNNNNDDNVANASSFSQSVSFGGALSSPDTSRSASLGDANHNNSIRVNANDNGDDNTNNHSYIVIPPLPNHSQSRSVWKDSASPPRATTSANVSSSLQITSNADSAMEFNDNDKPYMQSLKLSVNSSLNSNTNKNKNDNGKLNKKSSSSSSSKKNNNMNPGDSFDSEYRTSGKDDDADDNKKNNSSSSRPTSTNSSSASTHTGGPPRRRGTGTGTGSARSNKSSDSGSKLANDDDDDDQDHDDDDDSDSSPPPPPNRSTRSNHTNSSNTNTDTTTTTMQRNGLNPLQTSSATVVSQRNLNNNNNNNNNSNSAEANASNGNSARRSSSRNGGGDSARNNNSMTKSGYQQQQQFI